MIEFYGDMFSNGVGPSRIFDPIRFPGGEAHVAISQNFLTGTQVAYVQYEGDADLMHLAMWADAIKRHRNSNCETVALIPYLPGARQDRGRPLGAKVYADFINSMKLDHVVCFDPHSDVMPALLDRCTVVPLYELLQDARWLTDGLAGVIAPDVGARKRAEGVAAAFGVPVFQATKHRDFATGKLSKFECERLPDAGQLLVVDDICDGGGTFIGLAEATGVGFERLQLWVSHGIFSKGVGHLAEHYWRIATTDSHPGHDQIGVHVQPLLDFLYHRR